MPIVRYGYDNDNGRGIISLYNQVIQQAPSPFVFCSMK